MHNEIVSLSHVTLVQAKNAASGGKGPRRPFVLEMKSSAFFLRILLALALSFFTKSLCKTKAAM